MVCMVNSQSYRSTAAELQDKRQLENCFDSKQAFIADPFHEKGLRLQLHGAIYRPDSFVLMLRYCANLKAIRYEPTSLNKIVADKSHRVIVT